MLLDQVQRWGPPPDGGDDGIWISSPGEGLIHLTLEPALLVLLGTALVGFSGLRWRRQAVQDFRRGGARTVRAPEIKPIARRDWGRETGAGWKQVRPSARLGLNAGSSDTRRRGRKMSWLRRRAGGP